MFYRPNPRGNRPWSQRGYCHRPLPQFILGDSNSPAAQGGFRPNYNAVPSPPQYYPHQQFQAPPAGPYANQVPGPGPYRPHVRGPPFGQQNFQQQNFRPQQQFRPWSKPPDFRGWERAKSAPPPECERFTVLSYNILADSLATSDRCKTLYYHIPSSVLCWDWRRNRLIFELGLWSPDIMCFQEVDRFQDIQEDLNRRGYSGVWKMRTGDPIDGCAIFWRDSRFKLLHEESIEYTKLGLRDNVAQICVFEFVNGQTTTNGTSSLSTRSGNLQRVVICNIHVLFNPKRGEIKLGQIRVLIDRAHAVSKLWDDAPVVMCGDFNCTPESPMYKFIKEGKLDLSELPRNEVSGQKSAQLQRSRPTSPYFRGPSTGSLSGPQDNNRSDTCSVRDETVLVEPSGERILSKSIDVSACVESNSEETSPEVSVADSALDKKLECLSVNESVDETAHGDQEEGQEDCNSLSRLDGNVILEDKLHMEDVLSNESKLAYNLAAWTPMEIETATGSEDCRVMEHLLKLTSSYTEVESSSRTRDSSGEPLVTSYHRHFLGTIDYIWHSEGLQTARVRAPIPKDVIQQLTRGFPTRKWGSDHIALVSEFAFVKDASSNNAS